MYYKKLCSALFCTTLVFGSSAISLGCQNYKNREVIHEYQKQNAVLEKIVEDEEEIITLQNEEMSILEKQLSEAEQKITEQEKTIKQQQNQLQEQQKQTQAETNNKKYLGTFNLSFYSKEQFPNSKTCTGVMPQVGVTVAVDPSVIPLGSKVYIDGLGVRIAQDTGGAIKGNKMDVFVSTNAEALQLGRQNRNVWIIE